MHKIDNLIAAINAQAWMLAPEKMHEILGFLELRLAGASFTQEEVAARIGPPKSAPQARVGTVAVLPLYGIISHRLSMTANISGPGSTSVIAFQRAFDEAMADDDVGAILLDVDSPGGVVSGVAEVADHILRARGRKPIVAQANGMMCSAAYFIGSAADEVVQSPTSFTGNIGVFTVHLDASEADKQMGIKRTVISAGKYKAEAHDSAPLTDSARAHMQETVDAAYDLFVRHVAKARGATPSEVRDGFGEGLAIFGKAAVEHRLADRVATFDETLVRLMDTRRRGHVGSGGRHAAVERRRLDLIDD